MLKQNLLQNLGLIIIPLQIQLIMLLELPTYQLEQRIKEELESNPLLEEGEERPEPEVDIKEDGDEVDYDENSQEEDNYESSEDEFSLDDYISDEDDIPDYKLTPSNASKDDDAREFVLSGGISFRENLVEQLGTQHLGEMDRKICEYIIGNIDDDGYLRRDVENIVDDLAFGAGIEVDDEKIESLLRVVQRFDPAGVGARDLRECLLLQVKRRLAETSTPALINARIILECYFEEFSKKHYEKISKRMRISEEELKEAVDEILKLNPKPGGQISDSSVPGAEKIIPDFNLDIVDGELQLSLNTGDIPELRLNKSYVNMLEDYQKNSNSREKKDVVSFVKYKLSSARSFIDAVQQRNNTLMLTMTAVWGQKMVEGVNVQRDIQSYQDRTISLQKENEKLRQQLEIAENGERIRNLAQNELGMLRRERAQTETIYIHAPEKQVQEQAQEAEQTHMDILDFLLGLLNVFHIGE